MKKTIFIAIILGISIFASQGYCELSKSQNAWRKGPRMHFQSYYDILGNKIRFINHWYAPANWKNRLEIDKLVKDMVKHRTDCHVQEYWRWETLPENHPAIIILVWFNVDTRESGWCAIKNTSDHWYVASDSHPWTTQKDFTQKQNWGFVTATMSFRWMSNGAPITIWFRNPHNENGWTKHDIWYGFNGFK